MTEYDALSVLRRDKQPPRLVRMAMKIAQAIAGRRLTETEAWRLLETRNDARVRPVVEKLRAELERKYRC